MKWVRKTLAFVLTFSLAAASMSSLAAADQTPATDKIPGTERTIVDDFDTRLLSLTGYAQGKVDLNNRKRFLNTEKHVKVHNADELVAALLKAKEDEVEIIEIMNDIDMGYSLLSEETKASSMVSDYFEKQSAASKLTSPGMMESGLTQLTLSGIDGLTIFSEGGAKLSRAEWKLSGTDIIIRNLKFDGMWQWDKESDNKDAGWSVIKVNRGKGVWLDHCSFTMGYDGLCDSEGGANGVSYTWCKFGEKTPDTKNITNTLDVDSNLYQTMRLVEQRYKNGQLDADDEYKVMRDAGATFEQVLAFSAFHSKAFLIGSGDKDYKDDTKNGLENGNQRLEVTFAYSVMSNLGQRVVRMRQGKGHLFNCYIDDMKRYQLRQSVSGLQKAEDHSLYRCIDVHNGGSVAADTCVFDGASAAIIGSSQNGATKEWETYFQNVYNQALVVNSRINTQNGKTYTGSSWDDGGNNPLVRSGYYLEPMLGKFCWDVRIDGLEDMDLEKPPVNDENKPVPFTFNYDSDYQLPYEYTVVALDKVQEVTEKYAGAYTYCQPAEFWLKTEYGTDETAQPVSEEIPVTAIDINFDSKSINVGEVAQVIVNRTPSYTTDRKLEFTSSNEEVAEVLDSGLIVAKKTGTATITVKAGAAAAKEIAVEVYNKVKSVKLDTKTNTIEAGNTLQLTATVEPADADNPALTWKSSNEKVATVSADGLVTAIAPGTTQITCASVENPAISAKLTIRVEKSTSPALLMGDVNQDGNVTADDALDVLKHAAKLIKLEGDKLNAADMDGDGNVGAGDALLILQTAAKLI